MRAEREDVDHYDGIGGSVAAAVMGLSRYKTPFQAWLEYTDPSSRQDLSDNEAIEWGLALEPVIARVAAERWKIAIEYQPKVIPHPRLSFMRAHVDALVIGERAGMEVKNRGLLMARKYGETDEQDEDRDDLDNVLPEEAIQCQTYMACTGYDYWYLPVLTGGQRLLRFKIKRDNAIIEKIETSCQKFWDCVQLGIPPDPINSDDADRRWREHVPGKIAEADDMLLAIIDKRVALKKTEKETKDALDFVNFQIKNAMRDAEELRRKGKKLISWKSHMRDFFDSVRFKSDNPDLATQYTEERVVRVLR